MCLSDVSAFFKSNYIKGFDFPFEITILMLTLREIQLAEIALLNYEISPEIRNRSLTMEG